MPMNKIPRLREPRGPVVQQVRDLFLEREYKAAPENFYIQDIKLVENMDFLLQRCVIMCRKDIESSVNMLKDMLIWRKENRLYELSDTSFPLESRVIGGAFLYEPDKYQNRTLYLRASLCKNCAELKKSMRDFLTYMLFNLDDDKNGTTYAVILDLTDASMTNYDLDLLMHFVSLLKDRFPVNMDYVLAVNFPWILSAAWTLIKRLIPAEKRDVVQFINSKQIFNFIDRENCPDFLGGTCKKPYKYVPKGSLNTVEFLKIHATKTIPYKRLKEIFQMFSDTLPQEHLDRLAEQIDKLKDGGLVISEDKTSKQEKLLQNNNNDEDVCNENFA